MRTEEEIRASMRIKLAKLDERIRIMKAAIAAINTKPPVFTGMKIPKLPYRP